MIRVEFEHALRPRKSAVRYGPVAPSGARDGRRRREPRRRDRASPDRSSRSCSARSSAGAPNGSMAISWRSRLKTSTATLPGRGEPSGDRSRGPSETTIPAQAAARSSAARGRAARYRRRDLPLLRRCAPCDRRERQRDARLGAGTAACRPHPPPEIRLPRLRQRSIRRRRRSGRSPRAWRPRRCSPRCWSANTAITRRSIGSRRSLPGMASSSTARRWPNWVGGACWWLEPLQERLCEHVFASNKLFADDTPIPVLDPGRGRTKTGRLWVYARDERPWGGPDPPAAVYFCSPDRKAERPASHLGQFKGVLQVDGYAGFEQLANNGDIVLAACWAHTRRKFYEVHRPPARRSRPRRCAGSANSMPSKRACAGSRRPVVSLSGAPSPGPSCKPCMPGWKPSFRAYPAGAPWPRRSATRSRAGTV